MYQGFTVVLVFSFILISNLPITFCYPCLIFLNFIFPDKDAVEKRLFVLQQQGFIYSTQCFTHLA